MGDELQAAVWQNPSPDELRGVDNRRVNWTGPDAAERIDAQVARPVQGAVQTVMDGRGVGDWTFGVYGPNVPNFLL